MRVSIIISAAVLSACMLFPPASYAGPKEYHVKEIPLNGKLRTADDPATIGASDFTQLINLRYGTANPRGIGGMTKINSSALTNPQIKTGIHYTRDFPSSESHVIVSSRDSDGLNQKVYRNDTAIPSTGEFNATALFTDSSGYGEPRFSLSPEGVAYSNGKDTALWLGDEFPASGFIDYDPNGTYRYDWTDQVMNSLTDSENVATLHKVADSIDSNTMLLLSLNNNVTDTSPTTPHTVTNSGVTFSTSSKFGSHAASFNGTSSYLTIPDDADFDFSGGTFTIDFWAYFTSLNNKTIYYNNTDVNNYIRIYGDDKYIKFDIYSGGSAVVSLTSTTVTNNAWHHIAIVESGDSYYLFVDGAVSASTTDTDRAANYTGTIYIGSVSGTSSFMSGKIDELRVSNVARWTSAFEPPTQAYADVSTTSLYVRSLIPSSGVKFYVGTANTSAATANAFEWNGSGWSAVSGFSDGTASSGKSLAQTGTMSWTSTASTAKPRIIDGIFGYWNKIEISGSTGIDNTTTISQVSVTAAMQQLRDIWDGTYTSTASFQKYSSSTYNDMTFNILNDEYDSTNAATFAELDGLASATDYLVVGYMNRQTALKVKLIGGHVNTTAGTVATVYYWNGTEWVTVGSIDDGTSQDGISFAKSGIISWNPPSESNEHRQVLAGTISDRTTTSVIRTGVFSEHILKPIESRQVLELTRSDASLYYYKITFSKNFSADVQVYYVAGIPAQVDLRGYKFPFYHQDRLCLANNVDKQRNAILCSIPGGSHFFNGPDSISTIIGDGKDLVAAASVYSRFGSNLNTVALLFKESETWAWLGATKEDMKFHQLSSVVGNTAPQTVRVVPAYSVSEDTQGGIGRSLVIWQGASGIYMSDGASLSKISYDIRDKFDPNHANYVGAATLATCTAFYDQVYDEYHWVIPGVAEWAYDLRRGKWYQVDRGSGGYLQGGIEVSDTNGNSYVYGSLSTGYLERLEYGQTFDGTAIPYTLTTGDIAIHGGSIWKDTTVRKVKLITNAKTNTTNAITLTHFGDTATTGTTYNTYSVTAAGKRLAFTSPIDVYKGPFYFHRFKLTTSTSNETAPGFEPVFLGIYYETVTDDIRQ